MNHNQFDSFFGTVPHDFIPLIIFQQTDVPIPVLDTGLSVVGIGTIDVSIIVIKSK